MLEQMVLAETAGCAIGFGAIRLSRPTDNVLAPGTLGILAGAAALGGALASGAPVGWVPFDALLRAGLCACAVLLGARARPLVALVVTLLAAIVSVFGSSLLEPLVLAGTSGLLLANFASKRRSRLLTALAGGVLANIVLRLDQPEAAGATALVAVVILVPLFASGLAHLGANTRRWVFFGARLAGFVFLLGAGLAVTAAVLARQPLEQGLSLIGNGRVTVQGTADRQGTEAQLEAAERSFARARGILGSWLFRPAALVPVVAQQWRALHAAAVTGEELSSAGLQARRSQEAADIRITAGAVPLDRLEALAPALTDLAERLRAGSSRLTKAASPWLLQPLAKRLERSGNGLAEAARTAKGARLALPLLPAILGGDGPRRYFLAVQNPAEARATGGYVGSFGEISAINGKVELARFGRKGELTQSNGSRPRPPFPPEYEARYSRFSPQTEWGNINVSPDLPTVTRVIAGLYPVSGGDKIDGVIAIDPAGLAALIRVVGPVSVPGWPEPISADNAEQILLFDQYVRYAGDVGYTERVEFIGDVAQEVWHRLTTSSSLSIVDLLNAVGPAVRHKHLMLTAVDPAEEKLYEELNLDGRMAPVRGDFLGVVTQNAGANKVDYFLRRDVDYQVHVNPSSGKLEARMKLVLRNQAPASGLPDYIIGNLASIPAGSNKSYVSIYSPWQLTSSTIDGKSVQLEAATELGRRVYSGGFVIPPMGSVTIDMVFAGRLPAGDQYRLDIHRQTIPAADNYKVKVTLPSRSGFARGSRTSEDVFLLDANWSKTLDR